MRVMLDKLGGRGQGAGGKLGSSRSLAQAGPRQNTSLAGHQSVSARPEEPRMAAGPEKDRRKPGIDRLSQCLRLMLKPTADLLQTEPGTCQGFQLNRSFHTSLINLN